MDKVLEGKVAIVTGASQGLGLEIAKTYVQSGASVMICARDAEMLEHARAQLAALAGPDQRVAANVVDVSSERDVKAMVSETVAGLGGCHILVNNAGIHGAKGAVETVDWAEWVKAIEINVLGSVLMCREVLPHFKRQNYGKIIQLSGGGATKPMPYMSAYAASKAAIVRFAETLAEEVRGCGIDVNSVAPGALNTRLLYDVLDAGVEKVGQAVIDGLLKQKENGGSPPARAAELAVFLGSPASDGITGKLISAIWDNWDLWAGRWQELATSDAYTLRRIAGRERGLEWGDK